MKILLTGARGQVGYELERSLQGLGEVVAPGRDQLDLANPDQLRALLRALRPGLIVNAAAYTAVDQAEHERALAFRINADAPALMAAEAALLGAAMVHFSTDYVFDGKRDSAYRETDPACPINVYGESKLAGEQAVAAAGIAHLILRTSWVYSMRRSNFVLRILHAARERDRIEVVSDQIGSPTWSRSVADATALALGRASAGGPAWWDRHGGLYHLAAGGHTTRAAFAEEIIARAGLACRVMPTSSAAHPGAAARPGFSALDSGKLAAALCRMTDWRQALTLCLDQG